MKQHNLQVSGGKAALVARVLRYVREDNDATSDSELQASDSEDDAQSDSSEMGDFIEHSCRMRYSTKQVKDSGVFPGGWGGGGVRHNLSLLRGWYCVIFLLATLIFRPPPHPPPDNYCTVPQKVRF